ncbi:MAG: 60S ribosomal protein L27A [Amphiamblys sp. WSBS2006]|nr:MAG: 60S ribosomal protein L27A [Amphiamblys sp. WSBS2006]
MPTRTKKSRKLRGHVSCGYGRVGKHRKHSGGRGMAGGLKHMKTNIMRYHPDYFKKTGMRRFNQHKNQDYCPTVNIDRVWSFVDEDTKNARPEGKAPVVDVTKMGFFKVLGRGFIPNRPVIVKAKYFTRMAEEKIKQVGGTCVLTA